MTRVFFALEVTCPWPNKLPKARYLLADERHITLAFLGEQNLDDVVQKCSKCNFSRVAIAPTGIFDSCLFLPAHKSRCVSWHVDLLTQKEPLAALQKELTQLFLPEEKRDFLPHVTIGRYPFDKARWQKAFRPLPLYAKAIHLYESLGNLRYTPRFTHALLAPFEEIEHTADIAYCIRAKNLQELFCTAAIALSFVYTPFLEFINKAAVYEHLDQVISGLNTMIAHADSRYGCPIKAVSFHGTVTSMPEYIEWEMIVDV